jgi:hypothetical protein
MVACFLNITLCLSYKKLTYIPLSPWHLPCLRHINCTSWNEIPLMIQVYTIVSWVHYNISLSLILTLCLLLIRFASLYSNLQSLIGPQSNGYYDIWKKLSLMVFLFNSLLIQLSHIFWCKLGMLPIW